MSINSRIIDIFIQSSWLKCFEKIKCSDTYNFAILFIYSTPYTPESPVANFLDQLESEENML